jgi:hypothetical protein
MISWRRNSLMQGTLQRRTAHITVRDTVTIIIPKCRQMNGRIFCLVPTARDRCRRILVEAAGAARRDLDFVPQVKLFCDAARELPLQIVV